MHTSKPRRRRLSALFAAMALTSGAACVSDEALTVPYDTARPPLSQWMKRPAVLVFSKTEDWRHNEGIAGASLFFAQRARDASLGFFLTENGAIFNDDDLKNFSVVVFNNVSGDVLDAGQEASFRAWLEAGGAWIGIHGSGSDSHQDWPWYDKQVVGPEFIGHTMEPQFQEARVVSLAAGHPIMQGVAAEWRQSEEWYSFDSSAAEFGMTALIGVDEKTYSPDNPNTQKWRRIRMSDDPAKHPVAWVSCVGRGKAFYSALGHSFEAYENPDYRRMLANVFDWAVAPGAESACAQAP